MIKAIEEIDEYVDGNELIVSLERCKDILSEFIKKACKKGVKPPLGFDSKSLIYLVNLATEIERELAIREEC